MYHNHFGLQKAPFKITPDTDLFYAGGQRGDVLDALVYAIGTGEGIVKVVGEVGSGKTMLCRMLELRLPKQVEIVYIANPSLKPEDILNAIAIEMDLDVSPTSNRLKVLHLVQQRLLKKHAENKQVVVFVEEAQGMPLATLEEIRLLSNLETQRDKLLQIVLFGQPELNKNLARKHIRQLRERIVHSFSLQPLTTEAVRDYVHFRMDAAGYRGPEVVTKPAYRLMAKASEGLIRRVNILADKALLAAFADNTHTVTKNHVAIAIADSEFRRGMGTRLPELTLAAGLATLLIAGLLAAKNIDLVSAFEAWPQAGWLTARATETQAAPTATWNSTIVAQEPAAPVAPPKPGPALVDSSPPPALQSIVPQREPAALAKPIEDATPPVALLAGLRSEPAREIAVAETLNGPETPAQRPAPLKGVETIAIPTPAITATPTPKLPVADVPVTPNLAMNPEESTPSADTPEFSSAPKGRPKESPTVDSPTADPVEVVLAPTPKSPPRERKNTWVDYEPNANSLVARRLAATQSWLEVADRRHFSIQLLLTNAAKRRNLEAFLAKWERAGELQDVYVYPTVIRDKVWFGVLYNEFPTISAARDALKNLPADLKRHRPFIRNVRDVG